MLSNAMCPFSSPQDNVWVDTVWLCVWGKQGKKQVASFQPNPKSKILGGVGVSFDWSSNLIGCLKKLDEWDLKKVDLRGGTKKKKEKRIVKFIIIYYEKGKI